MHNINLVYEQENCIKVRIRFFSTFLAANFLLQNLDTYVLIILQNNVLSYYNFGHFETAETNPLHFEEEFIKRTPTFMCFVFVNERLFLLLVTKKIIARRKLIFIAQVVFLAFMTKMSHVYC